MQAWGATALMRLHELDDSLTASVLEVGEARYLLFARPAPPQPGARIALALRIDALGVRASLEVPAASASAVCARLSDPTGALEVTAALEALPEQFTIGVDGDPPDTEALGCTTHGLKQLLDRGERSGRALRVEWHVPREIAARHAAILEEELEDAVVALGELLVLLAGEVEGGAATLRPRRRARHRAAPAGARSGGGRFQTDRDDDRDRDERRARAPRRERKRDAETDAEPALRRGVDAAPPPLQGLAGQRTVLRASLRRRPTATGVDPIKRGAHVRVLAGPFSGKVGVVQDLDGKGGARVLLGLLAVHLGVKDLATSLEGHQRPLLSTSHRKLPPVRS
jgi:hypothetical protein